MSLILLILFIALFNASYLASYHMTNGHTLKLITNFTDNVDTKDKVDRWSMTASMLEGMGAFTNRIHFSETRGAKFDWNINLDAVGLYQLNWRYNYEKNRILFAIEINKNESNFKVGSDIFALGFSDRGEFFSSDFCLLWFDLSHQVHLQDAKSDSNGTLILVDSSESVCKLVKNQDVDKGRVDGERKVYSINYLEGNHEHVGQRANADSKDIVVNDDDKPDDKKQDKERDNFEIVFERPLEVCNGRDDYYAIDNGTTHMIWFALRGPVLSLDGINLTNLIKQEQEAIQIITKHHNSNETVRSKRNFEFGVRRAQLIATKPSQRSTLAVQKSSKFDIHMDKFEVPDRETTYWCKLFKLPKEFELKKFHITGYEAIIESGNEHVVHHMELFNCASNLSPKQRADLDSLYESKGGWSGECGATNRPLETNTCRRVILAWAMGAKPLVYPEQVGQSIGGGAYNPYVVLEIHYNNVGRARNLVDSSGLRFHYSSKLRLFDAGVLEVGLEYTDKNSIPPGMVTPLAGYCVSECTRAAMTDSRDGGGVGGGGGGGQFSLSSESGVERGELDTLSDNQRQARGRFHHRRRRLHHHHGQAHLALKDDENEDSARPKPSKIKTETVYKTIDRERIDEGIYIFAAQMHTHLTGVGSWTEHVREGRLLGELQRDDHYSPHFQEIRLLPRPVFVAPGDALIHYCLYDTRKRVNITLGGFSTTDEMCVTYLHYYPKIDLEVCKSSVETGALDEYFENLARDELQDTTRVADDKALEIATGKEEKAPEREKENARKLDSGKLEAQFGNRPPASGTLKFSVKSVSENYRSIKWSPRRSRELIEFYSNAPLSMQCNRSDGSRWPGFWRGIEPTKRLLGRQFGGLQEKIGLSSKGWHQVPALASVGGLHFFEGVQNGRELIAYRGAGYGRTHAQCERGH